MSKTLAYSSVGIVNVNDGTDGQPGSQGPQGVGIASEREQWYLSNSNSALTPTPSASDWSYTEPATIPDGKYLWGRIEFTMTDGSKTYSSAVHRATISGIKNIVDSDHLAITQGVWQSDITNSINAYDGTTGAAIRDRVSQTETTLDGMTTTISNIQTDVANKADGSTVTNISNRLQQVEDTADSHTRQISATNTRIDDLKLGTRNYIKNSDVFDKTTQPYTSSTVVVPTGTYVKDGYKGYNFSNSAKAIITFPTLLSGEEYVFSYDWSRPWAAQTLRVTIGNENYDIQTTNDSEWHRHEIKFTANANTTSAQIYIVASSNQTLYIRRFQLELGNIASDWHESPEDVEDEISAVRTIAEQTATGFSWIVQDGSSSSSVTYTSQALTAMANQIDLTGKVTFNSMNSALQNRITGVETNSSAALNGIKAFTGTCSTATGTAAKVVSCSDNTFAMTNGVAITVTFSTASTADSPTLNVNSLGAKPIYFDNAVASSTNRFRWQANSVITFQYNGTNWVVLHYENQEYYTSSTTASTAAKTASGTGTFVLARGTTINVYSSTANSSTGSLTLNVGSTGAYAIYYKNTATGSSNQYLWDAGVTITFTFNGSYWYVNDGGAQLVKAYAKTAVDWVGTNGSNLLTAESILNSWKGEAENGHTTINGGFIHTETIQSAHLATNAIMSNNFQAIQGSHFSSSGTFLDLANGNFYTPNFGVTAYSDIDENISSGAYINGEVVATSGRFGANDSSYWNIETVYDYVGQPHASLVGTGSPYLQTGNWQVSDSAVATRKYVSSSQASGTASYYKDTATNTFYDVGMKIPTDFSTTAPSNLVGRFAKSFFYGRKATRNDVPPTDNTWEYFYLLDTSGNLYLAGDINATNISASGEIYEGGVKLSQKYASVTDVGSAYLPKTGGTLSGPGNLTVGGSLTASGSVSTTLQIRVSLGSTSAATFTGAASTIVTPGVNGTLGVGNGGTGKASWTANGIVYASSTSALAQLGVGTSGQVLKSNGSAAPGWVNQSSLAAGSATNDSDGNAINTTYRKLSDNQFDTLSATDINAGNLVVTGAGRFTNGIYGNLTGNVVGQAVSVSNNLKIQLNGGTTEGTNQFTYNGSTAKNINITKSSVGLGDVENTALSTWAGSSNLTTTKVGTLAGAAVKAVDTSISAGSSSANLPTSAAVATFVEGKGYVTSSGVTSVRVQATSPVVSSTNTAQTSTLNTTISLADAYGDTKNPYGTKTANYVLAGPSSGNAAAPSFRALVAADIPSITKSKISDFPTTWALTNVTGADDIKAIEGLTGTSGILKKTAANTWALTTVISSISLNNDVFTITKSDGSTDTLTVNVTGQIVSGATVLTNASGQSISKGSASKPVYFSNGVPAEANTIPTITLNGGATTSASFYAPTGAGTSEQYLKSNGSGAPTWATFSKSTVGLGNVDNTADANKAVLTATKFSSARTITLTGDVTGSASSDGSGGWSIASTVADNSHNHVPSNIVTGNDGMSGNLDPITAAYIGSATSNKSFGLPAGAITIEYSTNGGQTWTNYGATDEQKRDLFVETRTTPFYLGKNSTASQDSVNNQLRVTIEPTDRYTTFHGIYVWFNTQGNTCFMDLERSTIGAKNTFTTVFTGQPLAGWSGNNIRYFPQGTFGGGTTQTTNNYKYRITFYQTAVRTDYPSAIVNDIRFIGYNVHSTPPNNMVLRNHLYEWDRNLNATFPAQVTATQFNGSVTNISGVAGTVSTNRHVWFSDSGTETSRNYDDDFQYNPSTNVLTVGSITGSAAKLGTSTVGATDRPIYLSSGTATQTTYRMAATNVTTTTARAITEDIETGIWYVNGTNSTDLYSIADGAVYVNKYNDSWIAEIYQDYRTGQIALRGKNSGTWQAWRKVLDAGNYSSYALPLSGGIMTGTITTTYGKEAFHFPSTATAYGAGMIYGITGNETLSVVTKNAVTSFMVVHGSDPTTWVSNTWQSASPTLQTKRQSVYVNELIGQDVTPAYNFKVNGTSYLGGEVKVSNSNADTESVSLKYDASLDCLNFIFN